MPGPRIRLDLVPIDESDTARRSWTLHVDDTDAGVLRAVHAGATVHLEVSVAPEHRRRGIARSAIGRLLGLAPWPGTSEAPTQYALAVDQDDPAALGLARALAFHPGADPHDAWTRRAPVPRGRADDITRFLDRDGRIDRYPLRAAERRELLVWVATRALPLDEVLDERAVNTRLEPYAPGGDVAVLRRYLVDHELVERTASGSQYARIV